jgi:hypothetical protein
MTVTTRERIYTNEIQKEYKIWQREGGSNREGGWVGKNVEKQGKV